MPLITVCAFELHPPHSTPEVKALDQPLRIFCLGYGNANVLSPCVLAGVARSRDKRPGLQNKGMYSSLWLMNLTALSVSYAWTDVIGSILTHL